MRAISRRAHRLEVHLGPAVAQRGLTIQLGNLKTLPEDYTGPRHVVTAKQLPPDSSGRVLFEWEERPGPEPKSGADGTNDQHVLRVCFVEAKNGRPA